VKNEYTAGNRKGDTGSQLDYEIHFFVNIVLKRRSKSILLECLYS